ncbi:hypothetical protein SDRG_08300 [Saprolegnia diclina VS20]|uniref:CST complex subunit TEN1 n=1 Tax=Saprolegnia diclina (strain VS20) TaxID=1156394 RepID=T0QK07_SAPDV|nr:hypothetical protein SDRG_08300 [Saprolegnia diclina VS20]EQC34090.1 hypothetical protein SDRG_08300 [Saprolegnia diclina VS20]|eukprot:XP_008612402.1 hypothetical protein SDRG_08300 [Saprolegnia diclina VS20]
MLAAGEICQIEEILRDNMSNRSVRVTGRLDAFDAATATASISFQSAAMKVATDQLVNVDLTIGSLYQFIGETYLHNGELRLRARVGRNVDGIDVQMFLDALKLRREFLKTTMAA